MTRNYILISISFCLWGIGEGLYSFFQPIYLSELGASPILIGTIIGIAGVAMTIMQVPAGYLGQRFGNRNIMIVGWVIGIAAVGCMALARSLTVFAIGMVLYGFSAFQGPVTSYIISVRGSLSLERAVSFSNGMFALGSIIGPITGGWIGEHHGLHRIYFISLVLFILSTSVIFFTRPQAPEAFEEVTEKKHILQNRRFLGLLGLILVTVFVTYLPEPLTPNFLQTQHGLDVETIGQLGSIANLGSAVIILTLGGLKSYTGILVGQVFTLFFAILMWQGNGFITFAAGYFFRSGNRLTMTMFNAFARPLIHAEETSIAYGYIYFINAIGFILAPATAGVLFDVKPVLIYIVPLLLIGFVFLMNLFILPKLKRHA
jgi:MFS family permease